MTRRYAGPVILVLVGIVLFIASPATGQEPVEPKRIAAPSPEFTNATCDTLSDYKLPKVDGLDYQYNEDMEAPLDKPRFYVTVEPLEGYEIKSFGAGFDADFPHPFDPPIAAGAWVHEYAQPDCGARPPVNDEPKPDPKALPNVGAAEANEGVLVAGVALVAGGLLLIRRSGGRRAR